jgi:hypothetical protein
MDKINKLKELVDRLIDDLEAFGSENGEAYRAELKNILAEDKKKKFEVFLKVGECATHAEAVDFIELYHEDGHTLIR